ncbi:MAG: hypothetical protein ACR2JI_02025 [Mycobacterium sp.]
MGDSASLISLGITASASLLGTIVGGLTAFWTTKKSYEHQAQAEDHRQRLHLLRDSSTRFISAVSSIPLASTGLARIAVEWGPKAVPLTTAVTDDEVSEAARGIHPGIEADGGPVAVLMRLFRETGIFDADIKAGTALLSELRLVAPGDVADSAQRVLYSAFAAEIAAAFAPQLVGKATNNYNTEVNDFFNHVRHHLNVENIEFDFINENTMGKMLDLKGDSNG